MDDIFNCEMFQTANISLTVLHAPSISIHKTLHSLHSSVRVEMVCLVRAEPRPEVRWYKDTMLLDPVSTAMQGS